VPCAVAGDAPGQDLASLSYILSQAIVIFIINKLYFINAKTADLLFLYALCLQVKKPPCIMYLGYLLGKPINLFFTSPICQEIIVLLD